VLMYPKRLACWAWDACVSMRTDSGFTGDRDRATGEGPTQPLLDYLVTDDRARRPNVSLGAAQNQSWRCHVS